MCGSRSLEQLQSQPPMLASNVSSQTRSVCSCRLLGIASLILATCCPCLTLTPSPARGDTGFSLLNFEISAGVMHPSGTEFLVSVNIFLKKTLPQVAGVRCAPLQAGGAATRFVPLSKQLCPPSLFVCLILFI